MTKQQKIKMAKKRWEGHVYKTKEQKLEKQRKRSHKWARKNKDYYKKHYLKKE